MVKRDSEEDLFGTRIYIIPVIRYTGYHSATLYQYHYVHSRELEQLLISVGAAGFQDGLLADGIAIASSTVRRLTVSNIGSLHRVEKTRR